MSKKEAVAVWTPKEFKGNDLIPYEAAPVQVANIPLVGNDNIDANDMVVPALNLLHGTSKAVTDGVEDAAPGRFMHSGTEQVLPEGDVRLIVVHYHKSNALFPKEDDRYANLETCIAQDGIEGTVYGLCEECKKCTEWDNVNSKPPLGAEVHNFVCMTSLGPVILRMSRSTFKAGSKFLSTKASSGKNFFAHPTVVRVTQEPKTLPTGKVTNYYALQMAWQTTEDVPEGLQLAAYELYKSLAQKHETGNLKSNDDAAADAGFELD